MKGKKVIDIGQTCIGCNKVGAIENVKNGDVYCNEYERWMEGKYICKHYIESETMRFTQSQIELFKGIE